MRQTVIRVPQEVLVVILHSLRVPICVQPSEEAEVLVAQTPELLEAAEEVEVSVLLEL